MSSKLIFTRYQNQIATMLYDGKRAVELSVDTEDDSMLGSIYVGRVTTVVKNIGAAFIDIGSGQPCYFSIAENEDIFYTKKGNSPRLVMGDELLVQVSKEAIKTKAPTVSANLNVTGKYLVLTSAKKQIGISSKIYLEKRKQLTEQMQTLADERFGWIVRTNAATVPFSVLEEEAVRLKEQFDEICKKGLHRPAGSCLFKNPPAWLLQLKDLYSSSYDEILTDDVRLYEQIKEYLNIFQTEDIKKVRLYQDSLLPLSKLYSMESAFEEALRERVWLKSGAYLVIQPTEALTVIDVNTGKYEHGKNVQDTYEKINKEAAIEIARQIRLRSLSGIIIIDFINMDDEQRKRNLMEELRICLRRDPMKASVVDMTALGLVEVTRKRQKKTLAQKIRDIEFFEKNRL